MTLLFPANSEYLKKVRADRVKLLNYSGITPSHPDYAFASLFSQSCKLFIEGYFYGCILLTTSIADGLLKFLTIRNDEKIESYDKKEENMNKRKDGSIIYKSFEDLLKILVEKNIIDNEKKSIFEKIWENRHHFHHLSENAPKDIKKLEEIGKEKLLKILKLHDYFLGHTFENGRIIPNFPKYWHYDQKGDLLIFLTNDFRQ